MAPALAAGNTAVLKPSEHASVTSLELAAIAQAVGLPPGVLNVVTGLGSDAGAPLSSHPGIAKVPPPPFSPLQSTCPCKYSERCGPRKRRIRADFTGP